MLRAKGKYFADFAYKKIGGKYETIFKKVFS